MNQVITKQITLESITCCTCDVMFAMPDTMMRRLKENGGYFYCPAGHCQVFSKSEIARLKEKLAEQTRIATQQAERAKQQYDRAVEAESLTKVSTDELKRIKLRLQAGVCPCCQRTFKQLARHMKAKHPQHTG